MTVKEWAFDLLDDDAAGGRRHVCRLCSKQLGSRNMLFRHLERDHGRTSSALQLQEAAEASLRARRKARALDREIDKTRALLNLSNLPELLVGSDDSDNGSGLSSEDEAVGSTRKQQPDLPLYGLVTETDTDSDSDGEDDADMNCYAQHAEQSFFGLADLVESDVDSGDDAPNHGRGPDPPDPLDTDIAGLAEGAELHKEPSECYAARALAALDASDSDSDEPPPTGNIYCLHDAEPDAQPAGPDDRPPTEKHVWPPSTLSGRRRPPDIKLSALCVTRGAMARRSRTGWLRRSWL
jgi:hypothetical protein